MTDFECPPFVGALLIDGVLIGTAFVCISPHIVVTCAHSLRDEMHELVWRSADGNAVVLENWKVLVCDADLDIAVITSAVPILGHAHVADRPRHVAQRGVRVFFNAVSEYVEADGVEFPFSSGDGEVVGEHRRNGLVRAKLKSSDVTPGCSGAPVLHFGELGLTVVGMISGRYNSADGWNQDTAWMVLADHLQSAVAEAEHKLMMTGVFLDLVNGVDGLVDAEDIRARMYRMAIDPRVRGRASRLVALTFQSNAT